MPPALQVLLSPLHEHGTPLVAMALSAPDLAEIVASVLGRNRSHRLGWALGQAAEALGQTELRTADGSARWRWTGRSWVEIL